MFTFFAKGRSHKYIKKIPVGTNKQTGKTKWRYIYPSDLGDKRKKAVKDIDSGSSQSTVMANSYVFAAMPPTLRADQIVDGMVLSDASGMHAKIKVDTNGNVKFIVDHKGHRQHGMVYDVDVPYVQNFYKIVAQRNNKKFVFAKLQKLHYLIKKRERDGDPLTRREMGRVKAALTRLEKTEGYKSVANLSDGEIARELANVRSLTTATPGSLASQPRTRRTTRQATSAPSVPKVEKSWNNELIEKAVPANMRTANPMKDGAFGKDEAFGNMYETFFAAMRNKNGLLPESIRNNFRSLSTRTTYSGNMWLGVENNVLRLTRTTDKSSHLLYNSFLRINKRYRKYKISSQLYIMQERGLRLAYENSSDELKKQAHVAINANIDIGRYAWAQEGFCYKYEGGKERHLNSVARQIDELIKKCRQPEDRANDSRYSAQEGNGYTYVFTDENANRLNAKDIFNIEALKKLRKKIDEFKNDDSFQPYRLLEIDKEIPNLTKRDFFTRQATSTSEYASYSDANPIPNRVGKLLMLCSGNWDAKKYVYPELQTGRLAEGHKKAFEFGEKQRLKNAKKHGWSHLYKID